MESAWGRKRERETSKWRGANVITEVHNLHLHGHISRSFMFQLELEIYKPYSRISSRIYYARRQTACVIWLHLPLPAWHWIQFSSLSLLTSCVTHLKNSIRKYIIVIICESNTPGINFCYSFFLPYTSVIFSQFVSGMICTGWWPLCYTQWRRERGIFPSLNFLVECWLTKRYKIR